MPVTHGGFGDTRPMTENWSGWRMMPETLSEGSGAIRTRSRHGSIGSFKDSPTLNIQILGKGWRIKRVDLETFIKGL
jgi:hypothetical protein